jgi:hypothetical protein
MYSYNVYIVNNAKDMSPQDLISRRRAAISGMKYFFSRPVSRKSNPFSKSGIASRDLYNVPIKQDKNFEKLNEPDIIKNSKLSGKKVHKNG